jgi:hypothetical protein
MIVDTEQRQMKQLPLFAEEAVGPCWHHFSENTRRDVVRHLAQLLVRGQETSVAGAEIAPGGEDE